MTLDLEIREIFAELAAGLGLQVAETASPQPPDLVFLDVDGRHVAVELRRAGLATPAQVSRLLAPASTSGVDSALKVLVADRIPEAGRAVLRDNGWGWLDLRGHMHLVGQGIFVDADVPAVLERAERTSAFSGSVGLEVATALLLAPDTAHGIRDLARELGRSPSTVSEVMSALRSRGLANSDGTAVLPDLFWESVNVWRPQDVLLADLPRPGTPAPGAESVNAALQLGFADVQAEPGWAMTGTLAAAVYGAPVAVRSEHPPDFYVPSMAVLRRAIRVLGIAAEPGHRRASIRVAPVPAVCQRRVDPAAQDARSWAPVALSEHWPLANPLFVALDLAADPGRGHEILEAWDPPHPWRRVW